MTAITVRERLRGAGDDGPGLLPAIHVTAVLGTADAMIDDVAEAEAATERLAAAPPADAGLAVRDIWLLRLRALLARAHGDAAAYAHFRDRYRDIATTLGFEGHIAWAEARREALLNLGVVWDSRSDSPSCRRKHQSLRALEATTH